MKYIFLIAGILWSFSSLAQDDIPDYRSKRENFSKMQEKDLQADLAVFTMSGIDQSIGKLPLKKFSVTKYGDNFIQFDSAEIQVKINSGIFFPALHKILNIEDHVVKIDNKAFYGSFGKMPKKTIQSIQVIFGADTVFIPPAAFADIYNPDFTYADAGIRKTYNGVYISNSNRNIYIYLLINDGAGGCEVTWILQDKKYLRRVVDFGFLH